MILEYFTPLLCAVRGGPDAACMCVAPVDSLRGRIDARRTRLVTALGLPAIVAIAHACWTATAVSDYTTQLFVQFGCPLLVVIPLAALCPDGVSSTALPYVLSVYVVFSALTIQGAQRKWMEMSALTATERSLRGVPFLALCPMQWCGITASWVSGGARFWPSQRVIGALFFTLRLAANLGLAVWCEPESYPPGHLHFAEACTCCVWNGLVNVLLTPARRHQISTALGCSTFVVGLKDLAADNLRLVDVPDAVAPTAAGAGATPSTVADSDGHALPPPDRALLPKLLPSAAYLTLFGGGGGGSVDGDSVSSEHPQPPHLGPPPQMPAFLQAMAGGEHSYLGWVQQLQQQRWHAAQQQHMHIDEARAELAATGTGGGAVAGGRAAVGRAESISSESTM